MLISSRVTDFKTFGPVINMWERPSTMKIKSVSAGEYTDPPVQLPKIALI